MTDAPATSDAPQELAGGPADLFGGVLPQQVAGWSVNRLASELKLDRRTVTNRLVTVPPLRETAGGPVYALADAARALFGHATLSEAESLKRRLLAAQAKSAELDLQAKKGELISANDVRSAALENARVEREALTAWPARVAPILAAELGVDLAALTTALEREVRAYMEERANDPGV